MAILNSIISSLVRFFTRLFNIVAIIWLARPSIASFQPATAYAGSIIEITGNKFSNLREDNQVTIGGATARVIEASGTKLKVISSYETLSGKIIVSAGGKTGESSEIFNVKPLPDAESTDDGPPVIIEGSGFPSPGPLPDSGTIDVLAVLVNPTDLVPSNPSNSRAEVVEVFKNVSSFYSQASYDLLNVSVKITDTWHTLAGTFDDYVDITTEGIAPNLRPAMLTRLMAECAQHAQNEGINLNNFQLIACVIFLDGRFIRAWGGGLSQLFQDTELGINISTTSPLNEFWINENANWGRFAHELGHCLIEAPANIEGLSQFGSRTLGEDVYASDLIDPSVATAALFDMMGSHDTHPIFSAYHLESRGWVSSANILNLTWDRNPFSRTCQVVAHGLSQNNVTGRYHIIKIKVSEGLFYYIEVRQRPPAGSTQIFDDQIPLGSSLNRGGVIVTKVFTDLVNNNQQVRFITLLHDPCVLSINQEAIDPARNLRITVVNDNVANNPLVCSVRIEWAQTIANDPSGLFDLRIDPWDNNFQSPDIWVDRAPYNVFDREFDAQGRPLGNGDRPRPQAINRFYSRIHNDGEIAAENVMVTFYTISPPGVGDNGNWAPLVTQTIANIENNEAIDIFANWVPVIGEHTCLKVYVHQQLGEISGGNNSAQENVFEFEAPAASVPDVVYIPVAVRNPLKEKTMVLIAVNGVKFGYIAQFPHSWIWLDALEERNLILTVVPTLDYYEFQHIAKQNENPDYSTNTNIATHINIAGYIPKQYKEKIDVTSWPASKLVNIGGILASVKPKKRSDLDIVQNNQWSQTFGVVQGFSVVINGILSALIPNQRIQLDITSPVFETVYFAAKTDYNGQFTVIVDFTEIFNDSLEKGIVKDKGEFLEKAKPMAQAFVFDADAVAEASSNIIQLVLPK